MMHCVFVLTDVVSSMAEAGSAIRARAARENFIVDSDF